MVFIGLSPRAHLYADLSLIACDAGSSYFKSLDACVTDELVGSSAFAAAFQTQRVCGDAVVQQASELEALRFCDAINGSLAIEVGDKAADLMALRNIETVRGLSLMLHVGVCGELSAGALVVRDSSMTTLADLWNLRSVGESGANETVEG